MFEVFLTFSIYWAVLGFFILLTQEHKNVSFLKAFFIMLFYMGPFGIVLYTITILLFLFVILLNKKGKK